MIAESRVMKKHQRNTKDHQQSPEARIEARTDSSSQSSEGTNPTDILSQASNLQNCENKFPLLSHPLGGTLLQQL